MKPAESKIRALAIATVMVLAIHVGLEGVDVNIEHDKAFDFSSARTWTWNPKGAGDVIIARTKDDDDAAIKKKAEALILDERDKAPARQHIARLETSGHRR